ncbi:MAG: 30S ribosomal protein S17 [Thermoleophilia bacterium]
MARARRQDPEAQEPTGEQPAEPVEPTEAAEPAAEADAPQPEVEEAAPAADEAPAGEPAAEEAPAAEADAAEATPAEKKAPARRTAAKKAAEKPAAKPAAKKAPAKKAAERKPIVRLPKPEHERGMRKERRGVVVSAGMDKTIVVKVETAQPHPRYKKVVRRSRKFHAHDEQNAAKVGDVVAIVETRPLSKTKTWRLTRILEVAK